MKKQLVYILLIFLLAIGTAFGQVTGKVFLTGKTDHSGVKIKFIAFSPTAFTDSIYTAFDGKFISQIKPGIYKIVMSSVGYNNFEYKFGETIFLNNKTALDSVFLFPNKFKYKTGFIKGKLSKDTTYLFDEVIIDTGQTLDIEAGTKIFVYRNKRIVVNGKINVNGNVNDSISFSSYDELLGINPIVNWDGIYFNFQRVVYSLVKDGTGPFNFKFIKIKNANYAFNFPADYYADKASTLIIEHSKLSDCIMISNANTEIKNSQIKNCITIHSSSRQLSLLCNYILIPYFINDIYLDNFQVGIGSSTGKVFLNNVIDLNFNTKNLNHFFYTEIDSNFIFKNNFITNHRGQLTLAFFLKEKFKGGQIISGNTIEGGTIEWSFFDLSKTSKSPISNNIFNCLLRFDTTVSNLIYSPFNNNIFKKIYGIHKYIGLGVLIEKNFKGDSIDTYFNLFKDPKFINGTPPYLSSNSPAINAGINENGKPVNIGFDPAGTCLESYFHKPNQIISADTLSISGKVHQGPTFTAEGIVMAINLNTSKSRISKVSGNGSFKVDSLSKGTYVLYAVPNPVSIPGYASTYYVNKLKLNDAVTLNLIGHIKETDIYLIPISKKENGTSKIQGRFSYDDENTDDTTSFAKNWLAGLSVPKSVIQISSQPCKNMPVLLYNGGNEVINSTITDIEGYYGFNNLSGGKYKLAGQRYGYQTENQGEVIVIANSEEVTSLKMIKLTTGLGHNSLNQSSTGTYVYPNPFQNIIEIRGYQGNISVSDITGIVYYEAPSSQSINTSNWPSGVYFLKAGNLVQKIVKQ